MGMIAGMEQVDAELPGDHQRVVRCGRPVDADRHRRRRQANRHQRGHGQTNRSTGSVAAGDDSHRRWHETQHPLELLIDRLERGFGHAASHCLAHSVWNVAG